MEGDEVDSESQYIGKHSPEYRKDGVIGAGRGLEVIRPGMEWGTLKQDEKVLNGHGEGILHKESAKA